jgi:PEP-CTERM motif
MVRRLGFCFLAGFFLAVSALAVPTRAALIYGDIAGGNQVGSGYAVGPGGGINNFIAEGFTMTGSYNLQSVDVILSQFQTNPGSNIALSIFSDNGGAPGSDLYDLSTGINIPLSGSPATVNLTGSGSFLLNAGTTYWLEMYATNPSSQTGTTAQWDGEFTPTVSGFATPSGPGAIEVGQQRTFSGGTTTSELRTAFQLNGVTTVPEPSTLTLLALGAVGLAVMRRQSPGRPPLVVPAAGATRR